jgi:F-type H+-transporting ATPase subunit b
MPDVMSKSRALLASLALCCTLAVAALAPQPLFGAAQAQAEEHAEGEAEAGVEHEGEHEHAHGLMGILSNTQFWAAVINFSLLLLVLRKLGQKPLAEFLITRRKQMERDMNAAAEMKAKAEAKFQEYSKRLEQLDADMAKLRSDIEKGAEEDKRRIVAEAEDATRRLKQETEIVIEQYSKSLNADVRREMVEAAVAAAEKLLRDNIGDADQQRLAARFVQDLRSVPAGTEPRRSQP